MMKRFSISMLIAVVLLVLAMGSSGIFAPVLPVFAQARYGIQKTSIQSTGIALTEPTWVYGIKIFADESNSFMGLYDVNTDVELVAVTASDIKDEIGEATQYDSKETWYEKPDFYTDGVGAIITTGVGFIYYGPQL